MKRILSFSLIVAVATALVFTSCEKKPVGPIDPPYDGTVLPVGNGLYVASEYLGADFNLFQLQFHTKNGLIVDGALSGDAGKIVYLTLFTTKNDGNKLPVGTFNVSDALEAEIVFGTDDNANPNYGLGSYIFDIEDGETYDFYDLTGGKVTIEKTSTGYKIDMELKSGNETYKFRFEGALQIETYTPPLYSVNGEYWGDYYQNGTKNYVLTLYTNAMFDSQGNLSGADGDYLDFDFQSTTAPTPAVGVYTYDDSETYPANTFNQYSMYAYVEGGQVYQPELTDVTLTITSSGVKVTSGTHTFTYDGAINYSNRANAPAHAPAKAITSKKSNFFGKDRLEAIKNFSLRK